MKLLWHAFPRAKSELDAGNQAIWIPHDKQQLDHGLRVLESILEAGLVCTPENFKIYADPESERCEKLKLARAGQPYRIVVQSRASLALLERHELSQVANFEGGKSYSHTDIFGPFAIGLDPIVSRRIAVLPAVYYYRNLHADLGSGHEIVGLGAQIVNRLDEIFNIFAILASIEARGDRYRDIANLRESDLARHGIMPQFEDTILDRLRALSSSDADYIASFFDTDRIEAWSICDFVKMLLSLYQLVDSTIDGTPLEFFNQREWRIIFHSRKGLHWVCLGENAHHLTRSADERRLRQRVIGLLQRPKRDGLHALGSEYLSNCWLLRTIDGRPFRDYVREIVTPAEYESDVRSMLSRIYTKDLPQVSRTPKKWSVSADCGSMVLRSL